MLPFRHRRLEIKILQYCTPSASLVAQSVKNLPAVQESCVRSLGWEDPLEKEMATHSSILTWRIPWTEKPGRIKSMGSQRVGHDWVNEQQHGCLCAQLLSHVRHFAVPWTVARQAPRPWDFSIQEYWNRLQSPSSGDLPHPEIKPMSPALAGGFFTSKPPGKPYWNIIYIL